MAYTNGSTARLSRLIPMMCLVLALLIPVARVSAQVSDEGFTGNNTYESLFGYVLTWDDPWEVDDQESGYTAANLQDAIYFSIPDSNTLLTVFASPLIGSLSSNIDFIVQQFGLTLPDPELLDVASDKVSGHILVRVDPEGENLGLYLHSMASADKSTEIRVLVSGDLAEFDEIIEAAQESLTVDGNPMFDGVDSAELLDMLENGEAIPFPAPENTGPEEDDDNPPENDDKKLPDEEDEADPAPTEQDEADPTPTDEDETDPAPTKEDDDSEDTELSDLGLIGEGEYKSPQFDVELTWTDDWDLMQNVLFSDTESGIDQLTLFNTGNAEANFFLSVFSLDEVTPDAWVESFEDLADDDFFGITILDQSTEDGVEVILYSFEQDTGTEYGLVEVYEDEEDNALVVVEVSAVEDDVNDAFESAQDSIELNGEAPFHASTEFPELPEED